MEQSAFEKILVDFSKNLTKAANEFVEFFTGNQKWYNGIVDELYDDGRMGGEG